MLKNKDIENKRLYECFGLNTQEELYEKIRLKDPIIKDLLVFLNNQKLNIDTKNEIIDNPIALIKSSQKYIKNQKPGDIRIVHCDSKNRIVFDEKVDFRSKIKFLRNFANNIYKYKTNSIFFIRDKRFENNSKILFYKKIFELSEYLGVNVLDEALIDNVDRTKISSLMKEDLSIIINKTTDEKIDNNNYPDFSRALDYNDFIKKYISKNIIGLNLEKDYEEINNLLKLGYQNISVEILGAIVVNDNKDILAIKDLSLGNVNSSIVNPVGFINFLHENIHSDGIIMFHNHPSGNSNPSRNDILITEKMHKIFNELDYKFYDHKITAKEKVYSIAKENSLNFSFDKLNVVKETKTEQEIKR